MSFRRNAENIVGKLIEQGINGFFEEYKQLGGYPLDEWRIIPPMRRLIQ